jgi:hypothetical protein
MHHNLRILFVYCWDDPWIAVIAEDLHKVSRILGYELYVVASGTSCTIDCNAYINTEAFKSNIFLKALFNTLAYRHIDLGELIDVEYRLLNQREAGGGESREAIKKRLGVWLAEAVIIMKMIQPDAVIIWNGMLSKSAVFSKAAHYLNIPVYYAEKGALPNSWYIDVQGINGMSSVAARHIGLDGTDDAIDTFQKKLASIDEKGESAWEQPQRRNIHIIRSDLRIKPGQKVIFFPGQVSSDANIVLFSPHFMNSLDALAWLVKELPQTDYFILAKPHPKGELNKEAYEQIVSDRGSVLPEINVLDAIALSDCVVSINSTIAFEATVRAKPVLLLGQGILCEKEYISTYKAGENASAQIHACMESYNRHKAALHHKALCFAAYLDTQYYAYRNDEPKTLRLIKRMADGLQSAIHTIRLDREEIAALFQEMPRAEMEKAFHQKTTPKDIERWFGGRMIVNALFKKIKRRIMPH